MDPELDASITRFQHEQDIFAKAKILHFLVKEKRYPMKFVASRISLSSSYICNLLRILKLPDLVKDGYYSGQISPTHLFILARLKDQESMIRTYEEVLQGDYSTIRLEERVREQLYHIETKGVYATSTLVTALQKKFMLLDESIKVKIIQSRVRAKIIIEMQGNLDDTTKILKKVLQN
ncbi:hypothetical protein A3B02_01680 [Candidatus Roizmanbacteria bacterium RIFCSPLOWO2_01_FULL_42_14]|uniref:ParB/Spo0J HTH domain-containing protein n=4 Tax=Candidatus Roizmaniibacteriota TaxID=1752723 RepID=A0A1F7JTQ4_9BACT|nr:MAG: hypothetical protein A3D08_02685 [Candidatus Roizmanbacteria bacterium RIFCSPHIGHO2_02_FULL_43_11]OGK37900.1 MAG: hypothetical protein A3F32_01770 [Candidatus Roizmanbacteria bacterium RIFCSPHIGHO2_12_FULL_42_10]OGK51551.1 MAG: hypothetical protein A3B02_01680 [Candidatus Roizmanbacteria bacterium RIFCSPLOWO2_01_FULL_42_14]OGK58994.1 MAG: hypothetical protein A3I56_01445 [Candidatus Roizmanbacteria bacterium RIFCSPLOWO2_02_FULL_43_10]